jgi:hypothetical protein
VLAVRALSRSRLSGAAAALAALGVSGLVALCVFAMSEPGGLLEDFRSAYYAAGAAVLDGPAALAPMIDRGVDGFVNLPIVAYLFAPLAVLDLRLAAAAFSLLGLASILAAWALLVRMAEIEEDRWLLLFLFAANGPLHNSFKEGNTSHMMLLALAGGLHLLRTRRELAAGAVLGLAAVIKLPLALFGAYFVLRRYWGAAIGFVIVCGAAALLSVAVFGWALHVRWFELSVLQFSREPIGAFNNQSIPGFLARLFFGPEVLFDWHTRPAGAAQRIAGSVLTGLLYLAAVLVSFRGSASPESRKHPTGNPHGDLEYLLVLVLAIVASPLAWTHYYAWLLMPIAFALSPRSPFADGPTARNTAWAGIFLTTPVVLHVPLSSPLLATLHARFAVSHVLLGGLVWFALIAWSRSRAATMSTPSAARVL